MAVLSNADRAEIWARLMQQLSEDREPCALTKADLRAAIDAADLWASNNAASFNSALPVAARTTLTAPQKARLLALVVLERYAKGA